MNKAIILLTGIALTIGASAQAQSIIADWTFESSGLGSTTPSELPGANTATTNFYAEGGAQAGTAAIIGMHAGAATYTSPAGDGSVKSLSSTLWATGDYYQAQVSTTGYNDDITLSYDQNGSSTGPANFQLAYSLTGANGSFVNLGSVYTLTSGITWSSTAGLQATILNYDLTALTSGAVDNQATVYLRISDTSTTSVSGGTVGTGGTDRIDNVLIEDAVVPEPSTMALLGMGGTVCLGLFRRFKK